MPSRLEDLRAKLAARTDPTGKPRPGYKQNCEALRAEINRLSAQTVTQTEAVSTDTLPGAAA
jgi:hypothetical protein